MPFYPDEGNGDDLEIENKYDFDSVDLEKRTDNQSENLNFPKDNFEQELQKKESSFINKTTDDKENSSLGIDQEELRKRIASFSLNKKEEEVQSDSITTSESFSPKIPDDKEKEEDLIEEDEEGVPSIKDSKIKQVSKLAESEEERKNFFYSQTTQSDPLKIKKGKDKIPKTREGLLWYVKISRWPVFFITLYGVLILFREYLVSISSNITYLAQQIYWLDNFQWLFEILIFILTAYWIVKKKKQLPRIAGIAGVMIGFSTGVIMAVIKLFWYREMWNIFYLSAESLFLAFIGLGTCLLAGALFYQEN